MSKGKNLSPLLPDRHPQPDFFVCDIFDSAPKSDQASMEYPLFTLSTKPDMAMREYAKGDKWLKLSPSPVGLATVHDRDILIYCISQCMAKLNRGEKIAKTLRFPASDLLMVTNRKTSGEGYRLFKQALRRLQGTQIETNITTGNVEQWEVFSFIDSAKTIRESREGRMLEMEITLSDWVFNAIEEQGGEILTISRDYFRLRKPLERRLYELARKHCGTNNEQWSFKVETLHDRTGSQSPLKEFRRMLKAIMDNQAHIPDYAFRLENDTVYIYPKAKFQEAFNPPPLPETVSGITLKPETLEKAKRYARGLDVSFLEKEWRAMLQDKNSIPKKPDGSFINYVKWYVRKSNA